MKEFSVPIKYTSIGSVTVNAENYDEAVGQVEEKMISMRESGSIPSDRTVIMWSGDELEVDGEEIDEA